MSESPAVAPPPARRVAIVLCVAIAAVSTAGTLVRLAPDVPPLTIAFWRVLLVAVLLMPGLLMPGVRRVSARDLGLTALGGLFLALHFWTWFLSLGMTTVMRSTLLVCLTPVWCAAFEAVFFGTRPTRRFWGGIAVALAGVGSMVTAGADSGKASLAGDSLAVLGGILGAAYFTVGRGVRARMAITSYGPLSCAVTAAWLAAFALLSHSPLTGFAPANWTAIVCLALGPQLLGHVGFNYAVGRMSAAIVAALILLEPVGATAVAALVLGETPGPRDVLGALITLVGVAIAVVPVRRPAAVTGTATGAALGGKTPEGRPYPQR